MFPRVRLLFALAIAATPLLATAQTPVTKHSLSLDVRSVASGASRTNSGDAYVRPDTNSVPGVGSSMTTSSFTRTSSAASSITLQIDVRNLARTPDEVTVEWYFLSKSVSGSSESRVVYDHGSSTLTVEPVISKKLEISSKPVTRTNTEQQSTRVEQTAPGQFQGYHSGSRSKTGARPAGWIVRMVANEQVLAVRASEPSLEAIGKDSSRLSSLIPAQGKTLLQGGPGLNVR